MIETKRQLIQRTTVTNGTKPVPMRSFRRWVLGFALMAFAIFAAMRWLPQTGAIVHMRMESGRAGAVQWYFDRGRGISETESRVARLRPGANTVEFQLPTGAYRALRFDPINNDAHVRVDSLIWTLPAGMSSAGLGLDRLVALANIDHVAIHDGTIDIWPVHGTDDPQMQLPLQQPLNLTGSLRPWGADAVGALEAAAVLTFLAWVLGKRNGVSKLVISGMALAAGLILAVAIATPTSGSYHPDEYSHLEAYRYYEHRWLPPAVDDPATIPSTSVWGFTYLDELDVVYDIAAHATVHLRQWTGDDLLAGRMFQWALWLVLCVLAACRRQWAITLSIVLLSPQIWYLFSYLNADAFPLFLSLVAAMLIADRNNGLHRYLQTGNTRGLALWVTAMCIGLLLVSKRNYLPLVPAYLLWLGVIHLGLRARTVVPIFGGLWLLGVAVFIGGVPIFSHWRIPLSAAGFALCGGAVAIAGWRKWKIRETRPLLMRLFAFVLICTGVALPRVAWDVHVNGWPSEKAARIHSVKEVRAGADFKPSIVAQGKGYPTIELAERGVPLWHVVFAPYEWGYSSIVSAFGVYGYMNVFAPTWLYGLLSAIAASLALWVFSTGSRRRQPNWRAATVVAAGTTALVLTSSLLLSWTDALQPQGRYLLPILSMFAVLVGSVEAPAPRRLFAVLIGAGFLASLYSFAFVALPAFAHIP